MLLTEPPSPSQLKVKLTALLITIESDPEVAFEPAQLPDAVQLLASVEDHVNVIALPLRRDVGLAVKLSVGSFDVGGVGLTVTVVLLFALPPSALHVMV